jgi:hypothetical protein
MRAHAILPDEVIQEFAELIGRRQRGRVVAVVVREKLRRDILLRAFDATARSLVQCEIPGWESPEAATD